MASISGTTSSLGNTSLRGYGGFASGIDRDSIIEQMTAGTTAKITKQKNNMTSLEWKQEAYRTVSNKMLELQDNYFSFASGSNLKYPDMFAKNQITAMGDSDITKFVSATGTSNMLDYLSILGVNQLASSASLSSKEKGSSPIETAITANSMVDKNIKGSLLEGRQLWLGQYTTGTGGKQFELEGIFTFPPTYTETVDGKETTVSIDYTIDLTESFQVDIRDEDGKITETKTMTGGEKLAYQLNKALSQSKIQLGDKSASDVMEFKFSGDKMQLNPIGGGPNGYVIHSSSSALTALGYNPKDASGNDKNADGITLAEFNENQNKFDDTYVSKRNMVEYLAGKKLTVSFGGQTKQIELIKSGETFEDDDPATVSNPRTAFEKLKDTIQDRLDMAFGEGNINVNIETGTDDQGNPVQSLSFGLPDNKSSKTLTITSDSAEVRGVLGIQKGASTKLSMEGSIRDNLDKLIPGDENDPDPDDPTKTIGDKREALKNALTPGHADYTGLVINGVTIEGVTADTSLSDMISKINANKDVGVKASYLSSSNQFVLVSSETGKGRQIKLNGAADALFGGEKDADGKYTEKYFTEGKNAEILVSYGNGVNTMIESSSNTFDLEGLRVTVSSEFGDLAKDATGKWVSNDKSKTVTFSAKADVDGVTETIKKFIEEYNEMIKEINTQVTTKPDKAYGPLTDEQKEEMSEKSIENWEKKAKQGLLYNDAAMRALSQDIQGVLTNLMSNGVSYKDLEDIGISISDDYLDGGTITFDEAKFKSAMNTEPEKVSNVFAGGGDVKKGLASIIEETMTPYATKYAKKNGNSYGRLIEEAGSEKVPLSIMNNQIYKQLKEMQEVVDKLQTRLQSEQDRYISKFTTMEMLINQMNSQSSYLAQFQA